MSFKVLFVYPNFRGETLVPPGITLLSRILKNNGFCVDVFDTTDYGLDLAKDYDLKVEETLGVRPSPHRSLTKTERDPWADLNEKINSFGPNLIAMSCTESTFLLGVEVIKRIEHRDSRDMPVILGGSFAIYAPKRALDFPEIDIACLGEGERPLLELCQRMERGESYRSVAGLAFRDESGKVFKNPPAALIKPDDNPTDFDLGLFDSERLVRPMAGKLYRMAAVETIRGCVYHCTFCNSRNTGSRKKSMAKVREEILYYRDHHAVEYIFFWADTFLMMSKRELDEFCEMYQDVKLPFWVQTRVETITDWRLKKLKDVGLHRIAMGIENGDEKFRQKIVEKEFSNADAVRATEIIAETGISYNTNNIVGFPFETPEIAMQTVELNRLFPKVDTTSCFTFTPYYGTPARDMAVKAGFMDPDLIAAGLVEDSVLSMPQFPKEKIHELQRIFSMLVKFPKSRWPEIFQAGEDTREGRELFKRLHLEYTKEFFGEPGISF
ncbi:MAG: radical SAM protein [bacterium]|nr:radical SAM protein [bacterium]